MNKAVFALLVFMLPNLAFGQGLPALSAVDQNTMFLVCEASSADACTQVPFSKLLASSPALVSYLQSQIAGSTIKVILIPGSSGTASGNSVVYPANGITAANQILAGFALQANGANLATASYNWDTVNFVLLPKAVNSAAGWTTAAGQLVDPTGNPYWNSQGYTLLFLYF